MIQSQPLRRLYSSRRKRRGKPKNRESLTAMVWSRMVRCVQAGQSRLHCSGGLSEIDQEEDYLRLILMREKTPEHPLDSREIKPANFKGNQSWIFIGRTYAKAEAPILWPPDWKSWLTGKDPNAGKDWRREKRKAEDEMVGWLHRLDRHEFE